MPHARKRSREWQRRQCMGCCYGIDTSSCSGGATVAEGSKAHRVGGLLPLFQHDERVLAKEQLEEEFRVGRDRFCARDHHQRQTACTKKADSPVAEKQCALGVGGGVTHARCRQP
jgi:tRNA(Phe) wybutosine-synthesizing methylase Tyw3